MEEFIAGGATFLRPGLLIFNALQLYYLSLTVFFYAEKRTRSIRLASFSLFCGASFFAVYLFLSGPGASLFAEAAFLLAVLVLMVLPLSWYLVVLYYLGVSGIRPLRDSRLHASGVFLVVVLFVLSPVLLFFGGEVPPAENVIAGRLRPGDYAPALLAFALYVFASTGLALAALYSPMGSGRAGVKALARRRALPAMRIAAGALFSTAMLVLAIVGRLLLDPEIRRAEHIPPSPYLFNLDVPAALLISIAVIASGRAIISYELFSEKALPRQGIFRHWRILVFYAFFVGVTGSLVSVLYPGEASSHGRISRGLHVPGGNAVTLVLVTGLMGVFFFAALGRRSTRDLKKHIRLLRPRDMGAHAAAEPDVRDAEAAFTALARDVLSARAAFLYPLGATAPLAGDPLAYPAGERAPEINGREILADVESPREMYVETKPETAGGAVMAVPLWSGAGPAGLLLLREKRDGDVYTQEEAQIAQAAGERILRMLTDARVSRLLNALQQERLTETRLGDHDARRILHDDILPELHAIMLENPEDRGELLRRLSAVHGDISNLLREMPANPPGEPARDGLARALRNLPAGGDREAFARVRHEFSPEAIALCERLRPRTRDILYYAAREAVRNAVRHGAGIAPGDSELVIALQLDPEKKLLLSVQDNGPALRAAENPAPQISAGETGSKGGAGQGLSLHAAMVAVVGGSLVLENEPGWTRLVVRLGIALDPPGA